VEIDVRASDVVDVYHLLVGLVTPRPIAWVTTRAPGGMINLAPFSFFNAFGANPPVVVFSPTLRRDGTKKDTLKNIESSGEFVINAAVASLAEKVNLTSKEISSEESELTLAELHAAPSHVIATPRVAESPFALECAVIQIMPIGAGPIAANLVIGQILHMHIDDAILDAQSKVDPRKLKTVARLGGDYWCHTSDLFEQKRP
jgi:flavin reductase (DIM6/NTAB) family NADH-FMN oxidoreductase RutF